MRVKRTTIEIDEALLERAKRALGEATTRGTVEHARQGAAPSACSRTTVRKNSSPR